MTEQNTPPTAPWLVGAATVAATPEISAGSPETTPDPTLTPPGSDSAVNTPPVVAEVTEVAKANEVADELVDTVTVTVPRAFQLRGNDGNITQYPAGVQEMEREHAKHWYSVACGVTVYER